MFILGHNYPEIYLDGKYLTCLNYKYFVSVIIFILSLSILSLLLSVSGINSEESFKLSILTLMNTVNSSAYGINNFDFQNLHYITKYFLIFFMIIGRVELLSLLLIAKKFLFKY